MKLGKSKSINVLDLNGLLRKNIKNNGDINFNSDKPIKHIAIRLAVSNFNLVKTK